MGITVKYLGRFGNNIFQYVIAKFLSEEFNLQIDSCFPYRNFSKDGFNYYNYYSNKVKTKLLMNFKNNYQMIDDTNFEGLDKIKIQKNKKVFLKGYFQNSKFYNDFEQKIKNYFVLPEIKKNTNDILMHVRLGDYYNFNSNSVISPDWYLKILKKESFDRLFIVTDSINDDYFKYFNEFNPVIISSTLLKDFNFIRSFDKIISSNSTLSWWACFLSEATKVYTFKKWGTDRNGIVSSQIVDLFNIRNISIPVEGEYI